MARVTRVLPDDSVSSDQAVDAGASSPGIWPQDCRALDLIALRVPYQAPQGRRVNVIGAYFTHGPESGRLEYRSWAVLPTRRARKPRTTPEERAAAQGLTAEEVGPIDAERFVAFLWQVAGRPAEATSDWQRARPLVIALDNYSVHTSQTVLAAQPELAAANVELVYLARYCPTPRGAAATLR